MFQLILIWCSLSLATCSPVLSNLQYHHQSNDGTGYYRYGFQSPHHSKMETKLNGITQGGYSYIDANGILQSVAYTADDMNGFRIRASNLPHLSENSLLPTSEMSKTTEAERSYLGEQKANENSLRSLMSNTNGLVKHPFLLSDREVMKIQVPKPTLNYIVKRTSPAFLIPTSTSLGLPVPHKMIHSSLHHTQDSLGQYDYSYAGDTSAKSESRSLDGTTRGAYSYIDANGLLQQVHYIADHNGFRVLATNLPEA
ncbi:uncharacterized protein [Chelonus insularis]|uniref:uncharacterized protein isoform X2 n=1 Tax=Chelonus insularis TaxID=460826 RepID=UPI00158ACD6D|nr:uncharacterized protein LOC118067426 isoform X2 [Chelonus insularis]